MDLLIRLLVFCEPENLPSEKHELCVSLASQSTRVPSLSEKTFQSTLSSPCCKSLRSFHMSEPSEVSDRKLREEFELERDLEIAD